MQPETRGLNQNSFWGLLGRAHRPGSCATLEETAPCIGEKVQALSIEDFEVQGQDPECDSELCGKPVEYLEHLGDGGKLCGLTHVPDFC